MIDNKLINQWLEDRNKIVETLDVEKFKKFIKKWQKKGIYDKNIKLTSDKAIKLTLCKMAWFIGSVSAETKKKALEWCNENGFSIDIR